MRTPLLYAAIPFALGIITQRESLWVAMLIPVMVWLAPRGYRMALILFGALGALMASISQTTNSIPYDSSIEIIVRVDTEPTTKERWQRCVGSVVSFKDSTNTWNDAVGQRVQIYIDTASKIAQGNTLYLSTKQRTIFDFYHKQGVTGRIYGYQPVILGNDTTLMERVISIRNYLSGKIAEIQTTPSNIALMQALTLGQRSGIDHEQRTAYSRTGAAHMLAVSGLHVGIIYMILFYVLGWIRLLQRGLIYFSIIIILLLWFYALITGMSPSVLRAVVMFTLYQIGIALSRESNNLNTLLAAGIILLMCNPNYLFDIGFQLSFTAMFGIVLLYRPLFAISDRRIWQTVAITLAAQVAVIPLSTYYFGNIPLLGIVTNLALWLSVPAIILATLLYLATGLETIGGMAAYIANLQNELIGWGASHNWIAVEGVSMPLWLLLLIYGVELSLVYIFKRRLGLATTASRS